MNKILNRLPADDTAATVADFFQAATITLAGLVAFLTVASTF